MLVPTRFQVNAIGMLQLFKKWAIMQSTSNIKPHPLRTPCELIPYGTLISIKLFEKRNSALPVLRIKIKKFLNIGHTINKYQVISWHRTSTNWL